MRKTDEDKKLVMELQRWMRQYPDAGVHVAVVWFSDDFNNVCLNEVVLDCCPTQLAAITDALLQRAIEMMIAMGNPPRDLIASCERARAAIDFSPPKSRAS